MNIKPIRPEDILPEGVDFTSVNGKPLRKGTIAAFLANTELFENATLDEAQKEIALMALKELAPDVVAIGLHKHVTFKNPVVEKILADAKI